MKIQCDVCNKDEASVFCTADEAALCAACDNRVHHANKLASKHQRFSLLLPSAKDIPICDICQERRAFLFCQQDRAILCRECDGPIHTANEHTLKHDRFLLTGVKLSAASTVYSSVVNGSNSLKKPNNSSADQVTETSSISEYLIETLPGWRVEDFLDSSSCPFGFSKATLEDGMLPFVDTDFDQTCLGSLSSQGSGIGIWVPQSAAPMHHLMAAGKEKEAAGAMKGTNRRWSDDGFTVPQISPPSIASNKRSRAF